jgi:dual specificity protein kinase YAK1
MEPHWQHHSDPAASRHGRFSQSASQQQSREPSSSSASQPPPPSGFSYETYHTPSLPSHPHSIAASPIGTPHARPYNNGGDITMEDADPYNRMKYPSRPNHQHRGSGQYLSQEDSAAARRYSPMTALSPSSPYAASPHQSGQPLYASYSSQNTSARQSPTRPNIYSSQSQNYYSSPSKSLKLVVQIACPRMSSN